MKLLDFLFSSTEISEIKAAALIQMDIGEVVQSDEPLTFEDEWLHYMYFKDAVRRELEFELEKFSSTVNEEKLFLDTFGTELYQKLVRYVKYFSLYDFERILNRSGIKRNVRRYFLVLFRKLLRIEQLDFALIAKKIGHLLGVSLKSPIRNVQYYFRRLFHFKFKNLDDYHDKPLSNFQFI